jgi:hypothetical protein
MRRVSKATRPIRFASSVCWPPPFDMPPPDYMLKDYIEGFPRRWLAVWDRHNGHNYRPAY